MSSSPSNSKYSCDICGTSYKSNTGYKKHLKTKKHLKNLKNGEPETKTESKSSSVERVEIPEIPELPALPMPDLMRVTLTDTGKRIEHLYHLSDIHIHCEKRHDEYRDVFSRFLQKVDQENQNGTVPFSEVGFVITGDFLDNKNRITPEEVVLAREFILQLAHRAPTFIIAGNHDKNLNFSQKEDNITAIVSNGSFPTKNLHYLKHTGVYKYENITFGVSSVFDYRDVPASELEVKDGEYKVALFHGGVGKYVLYNGTYGSQKNSKKVSEFDGYDYVLLGDIHKWQFLDTEHRVAYAGSMMQKNHGEDWRDHGFLHWNLKTKKVTHYSIENDYRFVTLTILDGKLMTPLEDLPSNLYVRWEVKETGASVEPANKVQEMVRSRFSVVEETYCHTAFLPETMYQEGPRTSFDLRVEKQREYMEAWLQAESKEIKTEDLDEICRVNERFNEKIKEDIPPVVHWRLIDLEFENIFCYEERQRIKFDGMKGVNGIVAPNNAGKSAIFDILLFTIFGKCTRSDTYSFGDLVHVAQDNTVEERILRCSLQFRTVEGGDTFRITRCCTNERGSMMVTIDKNDIRQYHGSGREGNAIITKMIGNFEDFMTTTVLAQNSVHNFLLMTGKSQKEFTGRIFRLDLYDKIHKLAKKDLKEKVLEKKVAEKTFESLNAERPAEKLKTKSAELKEVLLRREQSSERVRMNEEVLAEMRKRVASLLPDEPLETADELLRRKEAKAKEQETAELKALQTLQKYEEVHPFESSIENELDKMEEVLRGLVVQDLSRYEQDIITHLNWCENARVTLKHLRGKKAKASKFTRKISLLECQEKMADFEKGASFAEKYVEKLEETLEEMKDVTKELVEEKRQELLTRLKDIPPQPENGVFSPLKPYFSYETEEELLSKIRKEIERLGEFIQESKDVDTKINALQFGHFEDPPLLKHLETPSVIAIYDLMRETKQPLRCEGLWDTERLQQERDRERSLQVTLRVANEKLKDILEKKERLKSHRYDPNCKFCCENPFVRTAEKVIATESSVRDDIEKSNHSLEVLTLALTAQEVLRKRKSFSDDISGALFSASKKKQLYENCLERHERNERIKKEILEKKEQVAGLEKEVKDLQQVWEKKLNLLTTKERTEETLGKLVAHKTDLLSLLETYEWMSSENKKIEERIPEVKARVTSLRVVLEARERQKVLERELEDLERKLKVKIRNREIKESNTELQKQIDEVETELRQARREDQEIQRSEVELSLIVKNLRETLGKLENAERDLQKTKRSTELLSLLVSMTHHNGIPALLLKRITKQMEETVNEVLSQYSKMRVRLKNEGKETVIRVKNPPKTSGLNAKMLCGSEKFLVELAFRVAFQVLSNVSKPNFMVCDEGWSCLDEGARGRLRFLLAALLEHNEYILTVSHIQDVKAWMTRAISIEIAEDGTHMVRQ